ncbi:Translation initiation factor 3 subunit J component, partial [Tulasnella sp. 403]
KKWADEDADDKQVVSDWEDSEEEEKPKKPVVLPPAKKKGSLKQKLAEKAAAKAAALANGDDSGDTEDDIIDPALKKRLDHERELEADMKNASDLLGGGSTSSKDLHSILKVNPRTKEEFIDLSKQINELIIKRLQDKPLYAAFVEHHVRELAQPLRDVDIRKTASVLTTLANEKQREQREQKEGKKKKSTKPALVGGSSRVSKAVDTKVYEEALDDFGNDPDDFM